MNHTELPKCTNFKPSRIKILKSPCSPIDIGRPVKICILPYEWLDGLMDGQAICSPQFMEEMSQTVNIPNMKCFQFRSVLPGVLIAKGTIRQAFSELTSWQTFQSTIPLEDTDYDIIMDDTVIKVRGELNQPTIVEFSSDFIGFHRGDTFNSQRSKTGNQLVGFSAFKSSQHPIIQAVYDGDRRAYRQLVDPKEDLEVNFKLLRQLEMDLPITKQTFENIRTERLANYVRTNVVNNVKKTGSRFLCTDPYLSGDNTVIVPKPYFERLKRSKGKSHFISTPIITEKCVVRVKPITIEEDHNLIFVPSEIAKAGHRDFDGDLVKIVKL